MRAMSDRPPSPGDVPMACPFIAFEDDRQRRSTQPDRRHRCYAETPAAPRAISHQETYCLTGNFPACPTFQDWARREAARSVAGEVRHEAQAGREEDALAYLADSASDRGAWGSGPQQLGAFDVPMTEAAEVARTGATRPEVGPAAATASASPGEAPRSGDPELASLARRPPPADPARSNEDEEDAPAFLAARAHREGEAGGHWATDRPADLPTAPGASGSGDPPDADGSGQGTRRSMAARTPPRRPVDPSAPSWERPRRFEAYPTLPTRTGLGQVPPALLGLVALVVAAAVLFVLPGFLGGRPASPGATATPSGTGTALASVTATVPPTPASPTPLVYTVKAGDTLSGIAQRYGTTIDAIKAANPGIKDVNKIGIGDQITIPTATPGAPASPSASASVTPSGTTAP